MDLLLATYFDSSAIVFLQLILALFLGMFLGVERTFAGRTAGMRTYALVSMGSCLLIVISRLVASQFEGLAVFDPLRLAAGIVMGIGFLGAGVIYHTSEHTSGLTTAAGIWVTSGIGMAIGYELYSVAIFATIATLLTFSILWVVEQKIKKIAGQIHSEKDKLE